MKRVSGFAAVALFVVAGAGCMFGDAPDWDVETSASPLLSNDGPLVMCRSIEHRLMGLEVSIFKVIDHERLLAVKSAGRLVCVDDRATVRRAGVVPVDDAAEEPCSFCDGTPLPASLVLGSGEPLETAK
jgi:hypothetical protein